MNAPLSLTVCCICPGLCVPGELLTADMQVDLMYFVSLFSYVFHCRPKLSLWSLMVFILVSFHTSWHSFCSGCVAENLRPRSFFTNLISSAGLVVTAEHRATIVTRQLQTVHTHSHESKYIKTKYVKLFH